MFEICSRWRRRHAFALVASLAALWAATASPGAAAAKVCGKTLDGQTSICGLHRPEDMEFTPDKSQLIISQMGEMLEGAPGDIAIMNRSDYAHVIAYPAAGADKPQDGWGEAACPGAPGRRLSPHGIHLAKRGDGRWQLLVVNHGGRDEDKYKDRDSVEFFEVLPAEPAGWRLLWRGCVMAPANSFLNDVAALPAGGFAASHMMDKDAAGLWLMIKANLGLATGHVWRWRPEKGFEVIPQSEGSMPNGVLIDKRGEYLFVNHYTENKIRKIRLPDGGVVEELRVVHPDNSFWMEGGEQLLVASHAVSLLSLMGCQSDLNKPCPVTYELVVVDADLMMRLGKLIRHRGPPMGAATVGLVDNYDLYIGSFAGDRIVHKDVKRTP